MPRLKNYRHVPARDDEEADLHAAARAAGLHVYYDGQARRAGRPHIEVKDRRNSVLKAFASPAAALAWLGGSHAT